MPRPDPRQHFEHLQTLTRRHFLFQSAVGLGAAALGSLLGCGKTPQHPPSLIPHPSKLPHFAPKAKNVIFLHMAGAPSQLELFDFKPDLAKLDGADCPPSLLAGKKFAFIRGVPKMLGPQATFAQHGESRAWVSNYLPHFQRIVDEVSFLKCVSTDQFNHAPAQLLLHTGSARLGRPSMGSWATYGLGSENANLPGFVVLTSGGNNPDAGKAVWGSGFLPSVYQGVQCRSEGEPVLFLENPPGMDDTLRHATVDAIAEINRLEHARAGDPEILSRAEQYELAYRMQMAAPEIMDISREPLKIHELYGTQPGKNCFANNALLARRLVEKGVRFVQLFDWGWDAHGTSEDLAIDVGMVNKCRSIDRAMTALVLDLKQRGLLDETLVVWGGEFGRTPMQENRNGRKMPFKGRDHHTEAFTMWMCGGGIARGKTWGETDEIGYAPVSGKVSVFDVQATILNQLGFDHERLTYPFQGRDFRLTDVSGRVIREVLG
ncbi:MAG: DUF1501 domain-containing protein [Saprospiraceae bacterium]